MMTANNAGARGVEQGAKQHRLDDRADRRSATPAASRRHGTRGFAQQAPQRRAGPHAGLVDGRPQLDGQLRALRVVERRRAAHAQQHRAAHRDLLAAVVGGRRRASPSREPMRPACPPARPRPAPPPARRPAGGPRPPRETAPATASSSTARTARSSAAIGAPPGIRERARDQPALPPPSPPSSMPSARIRRASGAVKSVAARPVAKRLRRERERMRVDVAQEARATCPAPPPRRIHHLHPVAVHPPHDDEVREPGRQPHDHERGQRLRLLEQQVIDRHHHLLRVQAQALRHALQRIDRRAVDRRLAGFAQAAVADADAETFEQALERRRPAVQRGRLDHLGREEASTS